MFFWSYKLLRYEGCNECSSNTVTQLVTVTVGYYYYYCLDTTTTNLLSEYYDDFVLLAHCQQHCLSQLQYRTSVSGGWELVLTRGVVGAAVGRKSGDKLFLLTGTNATATNEMPALGGLMKLDQ